MKSSWRQGLLLIAGLVTVGVGAWTSWRERAAEADIALSAASERLVAPATDKNETRQAEENGFPKLALERLERQVREEAETLETDPFRTKSWYVPPPAPPPPPPPKPAVPTLPFQYMGKREDVSGTGKITVYLTKGDAVYTVSPGDTFDTNYRFEKIDKGALVIEYLPLSVHQRLPIGISE